MKHVIIILTRVPKPGQTKTRMMPALSAKSCARFHTCFLEGIERECGKVEGQLFVCFTPDEGRELLHSAFGRGGYYIFQRGSSLGERMYQAIQEVLGRGYDACILVGTDAPEAWAEHLEWASGLFEQKDVVLGPIRNGGYYLAGMKKPRWAVFEVERYEQGFAL